MIYAARARRFAWQLKVDRDGEDDSQDGGKFPPAGM